MSDPNIWDDAWGEQQEDWSGGGVEVEAAAERRGTLGATLYELGPGNFMIFHFHHGSEELLIVLRGQPTLRTLDGERQLDEGEVVHFPPGPDGAHEIRNDTDEPVRYLVAGTRVVAGGRRVPRPQAAHRAVAAPVADRRAAVRDPRREAGGCVMSEDEQTGGTVVELLLREPEIVAWLEDYRPDADDDAGRRPAGRCVRPI